MPDGRLPALSGQEIVALLEHAGFLLQEIQGKSGPFQIKKEAHPNLVSVPKHTRAAAGTLRQIIRSVGLSREEFLDLYEAHG